MKIYDELDIRFADFVCDEKEQVSKGLLKINGRQYEAVLGKHEIWIPTYEIKLIWTYHGKLESIHAWEVGINAEQLKDGSFNRETQGFDLETKRSIAAEYAIFKLVEKERMGPPIGESVFFKNVVSDYIHKVPQCDSDGIYGFCMKDASKLEKGKFDFEEFKKKFGHLFEMGRYVGGDIQNEKNLVNGYLIDIRKTHRYMIKLNYSDKKLDGIWENYFNYRESTLTLIQEIRELTQFPYKNRRQAYQSYLLNGEYTEGSRDTLYRYKTMQISEDLPGKSVLDMGCNLGAMAVESYKRGAVKVLGVDNQLEYIRCARDLARWHGYHINYMVFDLTQVSPFVEYVKRYFKKQSIDVAFALSLYKHIHKAMFDILNGLDWKICYIESHNAPDGMQTGHVGEMVDLIGKMKKTKTELLGQTTDRSPRYIWRVER